MKFPKLLRVPEQLNSVLEVLETAKRMELKEIVVIAVGEDDMFYLHNKLTVERLNWYADCLKHHILN